MAVWKVQLWNKWSTWMSHELSFSSEDSAREAAKEWEGKELWDVDVVEEEEEMPL